MIDSTVKYFVHMFTKQTWIIQYMTFVSSYTFVLIVWGRVHYILKESYFHLSLESVPPIVIIVPHYSPRSYLLTPLERRINLGRHRDPDSSSRISKAAKYCKKIYVCCIMNTISFTKLCCRSHRNENNIFGNTLATKQLLMSWAHWLNVALTFS